MPAPRKLTDAEITAHIEKTIPDFHAARLASLNSLELRDLLKSKNPYLYRAKNILLASDLITGFLTARLSSQEETIFGTFLERLAVFVAQEVWGGRKSAIKGIDIDLEKEGVRYLLTIKSGPVWGNDSQVAKMRDYFKTARRTLATNATVQPPVCINGCCYGRTTKENRGDYFKLCGQSFWEFLSGDEDFYRRIIEPIGHRAQERNDEFAAQFAKVANQLTSQVLNDFCEPDGSINWDKLLAFNSGKPKARAAKPGHS